MKLVPAPSTAAAAPTLRATASAATTRAIDAAPATPLSLYVEWRDGAPGHQIVHASIRVITLGGDATVFAFQQRERGGKPYGAPLKNVLLPGPTGDVAAAVAILQGTVPASEFARVAGPTDPGTPQPSRCGVSGVRIEYIATPTTAAQFVGIWRLLEEGFRPSRINEIS